MSLSQKLLDIAEKLEVLEEQKMNFDDLEFNYKMARADCQYLRHFIESLGLEPDGDYSVFCMTQIADAVTKALVR